MAGESRPDHRLSARNVLAALADLVVPQECGGCGRPDTPWCETCATRLIDVPRLLVPRIDPGASAWALARYGGPVASAIVNLKEHRRADLAPILGRALAGALVSLASWGDLPAGRTLTLVPAPTRVFAARVRGGDTVTAVAREAAAALGPAVHVAPILSTAAFTRDSAALTAGERNANLAGAVSVKGRLPSVDGPVVLFDDVLTTGATAAHAVAALAQSGTKVTAVVVLADA
ncbi:MAG: ComF family protein [Gordonia sp. (in: high G+C Gram-positive bacteria)]